MPGAHRCSSDKDRQQELLVMSQSGQVDGLPTAGTAGCGLSESSADLLSPTRSHEELTLLTSAGFCNTLVVRRCTFAELESFQGARPTSAASLTFNGYASPSSGNSTPTTSCGGSASSIVNFSNSGDDSATPPASGHRAREASGAVDARVTSAEGLSDEDGPYQPREIHLFDVQLARMLAAVSQAADVSPAQLLQILLNFAPEDYQDLVNAVVESGCSCVHLLACHLHNLRTMAEEAIDGSADSDGKDAAGSPTSTAAESAGAAAGAAGKSVRSGSEGSSGRKGKGRGAGVAQAREMDAETEAEQQAAQEALRASIMDQYRRVLCRLVDTALGLMHAEPRQAHLIGAQAPPPPPPPPPAPPPPKGPSGSRGGGGGIGSRGRLEQLNRSRSTPIPVSAIAGIPPPPGARRGPGVKGTASGGPHSSSSSMSAGGATPRGYSAVDVAPSGGTVAAITAAAEADAVAGTELAGTVLQAVMQQLVPDKAAEVVEALAAHGFGATAAAAAPPVVRSSQPGEQFMTPPGSTLAARGRSMSQPVTVPSFSAFPQSAAVTPRHRAVTTVSYTGAAPGAGVEAGQAQPTGVGRPGGLQSTPSLRVMSVPQLAGVRGVTALQQQHRGNLASEQRHAAALILQQQQQQRLHLQQQLQQQQLLQQQQQQQQLQKHIQLRQLQQQQQQLQHLQQLQLQQQQQQQQQLQQEQQQLHLLALLASASTDGGGAALGLPPQGYGLPKTAVLGPQAGSLGVTAAQLALQAYDRTAGLGGEPCGWRTIDSLAALQQQQQQLLLGLPFTDPAGNMAPLHKALGQQQYLIMAEGGLLPPVGTETLGGGADPALPFASTSGFARQQLASSWLM